MYLAKKLKNCFITKKKEYYQFLFLYIIIHIIYTNFFNSTTLVRTTNNL